MRALVSSIVLSLASTGLVAQEAADQEPIRVGMSGGYFPFTFVEQDELQGFEVDVMNAVAEEIGRPVEFMTMSFSGLIGALESGRIDTVANQITITPEREAAFLFTQPYVIDGAQVVVQEGDAEINGVEDLRGRSVAVNLGSNFEQLLRELPYADELDIRTYESNLEQDVALGRVDAFVMDRVSSALVIQETDLPLQLAGEPFSEIRNALPFRNDEEGQALRDEVDAAITALREDGTLTEISTKWFGTDITAAPGQGAGAEDGEAATAEAGTTADVTDTEPTAAETGAAAPADAGATATE
jgi:putative amino-acid transport system substrate-binding protein